MYKNPWVLLASDCVLRHLSCPKRSRPAPRRRGEQALLAWLPPRLHFCFRFPFLPPLPLRLHLPRHSWRPPLAAADAAIGVLSIADRASPERRVAGSRKEKKAGGLFSSFSTLLFIQSLVTSPMSFKHPATYKAAQISVKGGPFEIVDVLWKEPAAAHVVVKTLACGVCHSDSTCVLVLGLDVLPRAHAGTFRSAFRVVQQHMPTGLPRVPGHELIGDIVAVGPGETRWKVGDRVGSGWHGGERLDSCGSRLGVLTLRISQVTATTVRVASRETLS